MNQYNAAVAAGYSETTARDHSERFEKSISVGMQNALEQAGLTDQVMSTQIANIALGAKKVRSCDIYVKEKDDGTYEVVEDKNEFIEVDDMPTRLKALELAGKFKGNLIIKVDKPAVVKVVIMNSVRIGDQALEYDLG